MAIPENPITRKEHFLAKAAGESVNTPEPITREEMYLDAIASGSGGGGSGGGGGGSALPDVTSADNGKVLGVVDGAWSKMDTGGGGGSVEPLIVHITPNENNKLAMDKTAITIYNAFISGLPIIFYSSILENGITEHAIIMGVCHDNDYGEGEKEYRNYYFHLTLPDSDDPESINPVRMSFRARGNSFPTTV